MSKGISSSHRRVKVRGLTAVALAAGSLALVAQKSHAQAYWDPTFSNSNTPPGGSGTWDLNNTANWWTQFNGDDQPWSDSNGGSETAIFQGTGGNVALATNLGAVELIFNVPGYSISGTSTLSLGSGGIDTSTLSSGTTTISPNLTLVTSSQTWTNGAGSSLILNGAISNAGTNSLNLNNAGVTTFNGAISGSGGLAVTNTGTVIITGVNGTSSYTGPTVVNSGTLQVGISGSAPDNILPSGPGTTNNVGLTLGVTGGTAPVNVIFNGNQQISSLAAVANVASAVQTITINGSNTTLTVGITSSGATNSGRGSILFGTDANSGAVSNVVLNGGGNLVVNGGGTIPFTGAVNFNIGSPTATPNNQDTATVDMRGLSSFVALGTGVGGNAGIGTLHVGDSNTSSASTNGSTLYLAPTSEFTVGRLDIESGATGAIDVMKLGDVSNVIGATNIFIGAGDILNGRSGGSIVFNSSSGTMTLRGGLGGFNNATSAIIDMDSFYSFYNNAVSTSGTMTSTFDVSNHLTDLQISTFSMAFRRGGNVGGATDTFSFGGSSGAAASSLLNMTTMYMGCRFGTVTNSATGIETATMNLEGGTANISNLIMANSDTSGLTGSVNATLNISAGSVNITNLTMATSTDFNFNGTNAAVFALPLAGAGNAVVNVSGGTVNIGSLSLATATSGAAVNSGFLNITGGSVTMGGNITRAGGSATENSTITVNGTSGALLDLTGNAIGTSAAPIGNINVTAGTVQNVGQLYGNNVTIGTGKLAILNAVASNAVTNSVSTLSITGSGQLDLANSSLVTTTPVSTIRQYLINGYNGGASNGGGWNGTGGISSVNAATNATHLTALGYSTGTNSALGAALGLASNQTVVKYTIYGDANLDGSVDISDLDIVLSNYASGKPPTWDTGDFTYAGQTDITDLNIVLSNYAKSAPTSVATPSAARSGAKAAANTSSGPQTLTGTVSPAVASGAIELDVNTMTGDAVLNPNNAKVVSLQVASSSGNLIPNNWHDLSFYYGTPNWADSSFQTINLAEYDTAYTSRHNSLMLTAPVDYGDIFNTSGPHDLTFEYGIPDADGSDVDTEVGAVVYSSTPEPTTLGLMGLAMAGLMGRRRKSKQPK